MAKIIIDIHDDIKPDVALECVAEVISCGKISEDKNGKEYYCWATKFDNDIVVATRQYRKNDCFVVYKQKK